MGNDDNEQDAANNDAARSNILSAEVFDSDDNGEQYEYGDVETHAIDADTSDFSSHHFIAPDEARDAMGSDDEDGDTDEDMPSLEALDLQDDDAYPTTDSEYEELEAYLYEHGLLDD